MSKSLETGAKHVEVTGICAAVRSRRVAAVTWIAVALCCVGGVNVAHAVGATATRIGPDGGPSEWVVARPGVVLTGGSVGGNEGDVWASYDLGAHWRTATQSQAQSAQRLLDGPSARDPRVATTRYRIKHVSGSGEYLQVSTDGGRTYRTRGKLIGAPKGRRVILTVLATPGRTLIASVGESFGLSSVPGGLWRSVNGGRTWTHLTGFVSPSSVVSVPGHPYRAYVSDRATLSLYRTDNAGATWRRIGTGLPVSSEIGQGLTVVSDRPNHLLLMSDGDVYRSRDGGDSWSRVGRVDAADLASVPGRPDTVFASGQGGVFRSRDEGRTWTPTNRGRKATADPVVVGGGRLLTALGDNGWDVRQSNDRGATWSRLLAPFGGEQSDVPQLVVDDVDPNRITAAMRSLILTTSGGTTWTPTGMSADSLVHDRSGADIYALTPFDRILHSPRAGDPFTVVGTVPFGADHIVATAGVIYAFSTNGTRIDASLDGGATWRSVTRPFSALQNEVWWLTVAPTRPSDVYVQSFVGRRPRQSVDGGATWHTMAGEGLPKRDLIFTLLVDRNDPNRLYAGLFTGVWTSADHGVTWRKLVSGPRFVTDLQQDPQTPSRLYVSTFSYGMWRIDL